MEIKDEEIEKTLKDLQEMRVKEAVVDRGIKDNDKVILDIGMYLDKVPLEGGQNKDTAVIIGKDYIIPGFDKKLLGTCKGETREFNLPYPKDYHMKNIAGKMVEFKVTIKDVYKRELPALDDQFAKGLGLKKFDELKDNIKKSIKVQKESENKQRVEKEMLEKIIAKSRFGDIPEMLVDHEAKAILAELEQTVTSQGGKFEDYLSSINKTQDQLTLDLLPEAVKRVKISLLIREVAQVEKIKVKEEEIENYTKDMKKYYENAAKTMPEAKEMLEKINTPEHKNYVVNVLASRKVVDKLSEWNIE